jgi:tetratricopeptide (TPR) repeat protein
MAQLLYCEQKYGDWELTLSKKRKTVGGPKRRHKSKKSQSTSLINQGNIAFRRKDYDQAILRWQMARSQQAVPADKQADFMAALAEAYFRRGTQKLVQNSALAIDDFKEASRLKPDDGLYAYYVGLSQHRTHALAEAIQHYRQALEIDPTLTRAAYALGIALAESGENVTRDPVWSQLSAEQQAYLQHQPTDAPLSQALADMAKDHWDEAVASLEAALTSNSSALAHYYQGVTQARNGDDAAALEQWQIAYNAGLATPHLINNLVLAYTLRAEAALADDQIDAALEHAEMGLIIDLTHTRLGDLQAHIRFARGYQAAEKGNWQKALQEWEGVENATGANARALAANIALAYEKVDENLKAAEAWREFARRRPRKEGSEGWLSRQQVARLWTRISNLYLKASLPEEAITTLQNALKYQPDDIELGLSLAHGYISVGRIEAAHNQLNRMLKAQPDHVETLVLKAELTEVAPENRWYSPFYSDLPGIAEWKAVLATGDESYVPIAKQHLKELYEEAFDEALEWGNPALAKQKAEAAFEVVPDAHILRALYLHVLLREKPRGKKAQTAHEATIREHADLIDLTDERALHQLIDTWHSVDRHAEAAATLDKANAARTLGPEFYIGIAGCALYREQDDIAHTYFDEVLKRAETGERLRWQARIGRTYAEQGDEDQAEAIWQQILKEDPDYGYAHHYLWVLHHRRQNQREAQKHLKKAQRWANEHHDNELKAEIGGMQSLFNNPLQGLFSMLPPDLDPRQMPPELLEMMLGGILDDEFDDDDEFDAFDGFDFNLPSFGRRR